MAGRNNIGAMDQRVTFQSRVDVDDGQGGRTKGDWADIGDTPTMWAEVTQFEGAEGERDVLRQANEYKITIKIRNRSDLTETMAVVWRGRRYNLRSILPFDARQEFLSVQAEAGVPT